MAFQPVSGRLENDITELSRIHAAEYPGWTRDVFGDAYRESRNWISAKMRAEGLEVTVDDAGNVIGVLAGQSPAAPALVTGSHTDTVIGGGRFDGVVGVLGALEAVRQLRETGTRLTRDLIVVDFLGEESNQWGLSCLGSRAVCGELAVVDLDRRSSDGQSLADRYARFGIDPSTAIAEDRLRTRPLHAYVELHIEQGPLLEDAGAQIGVVTAIAGIERLLATFEGRADHAGTRPMNDRRDAMVAAANAVLSVQQVGCGAPVHGVATTTHLTNAVSSPNVVPGAVQLRAEMRSVDAGWLGVAKQRLAEDVLAKARTLGVDVTFDWTTDNGVVSASTSIQDVIAEAATRGGLAWQSVPSGATHDAAHLARLCPMGMIFVPSRDGRSHCPEEWTDVRDIVEGVRVLAETLRRLDTQDRIATTGQVAVPGPP
jgi:N-carbamoyl-L-amino-acid hydrolase